MFGMSKRTKGSISILLCLILLPMVTYSTMIIDASRLQMVRSNIAGAGDLTLNAIMSEYNEMLEEMYGLFANCDLTTADGEKQLQTVLESYFQQTVEGRFLPQIGKDGEYIQNAINGLVDRGMRAGEDIDADALTDFLNLNLQSFTADPVVGSALANPNTMKRQIIEYMKYRGPVSIASTLLGKLDYLKDSDKQVDACDKKVDYTKQLGKIQEPCLATYEAIESKYNIGALLMNEMSGKGITKKEVDYLLNKGTKLTGALDCIIPYSRQQLEHATAFYLMDANSPFYHESKLNANYLSQDEKFGRGNHYDYGSYKNEVDLNQYKGSNTFKLQVPTNTEHCEYVSQQVNDNLDDRINKNIGALQSIWSHFAPDLGYNDSQHRFFTKIDYINSSAGFRDTTNKNRTVSVYDDGSIEGEFNKYKRANASSSPSNANVDWTPPGASSSVKYYYPGFDDLPYYNYSAGRWEFKDSSKLYQPLKPFLNSDNGDIADNKDKITANDNEFFGNGGKASQYDNSINILQAQLELNGPLAEGIKDFAEHHAKLSALKQAYDEIYKQLRADIQAKFQPAVDAEMERLRGVADGLNIQAKNNWVTEWNSEANKETRENYEKEREEEHKNPDGTYDDDWPLIPECPSDRLVDRDAYARDNINMTSVWNGICNGQFGLDDVERYNVIIDGCMSQMNQYEWPLNNYIAKIAQHNDVYFRNFGKAYAENASGAVLSAGSILKIMSKGLDEASKQLAKIQSLYDGDGTEDNPGLKNVQKDWESSIGTINSDSSKAAMTSDYNTLTGQFSKEEVDDLKKLVDDLKKDHVDKMISDLSDVKYIEQSLFKFDPTGTQFNELAGKPIGKNVEAGFKNYYNKNDTATDGAEKIVTDANNDMWKLVKSNTDRVKLPDYAKNDKIHKAVVSKIDGDTISEAAKEFLNDNFDSKSLDDIDKIRYFQILDGIKDELGCAASKADKEKGGVPNLKDPDNKDFLDPEEAFMVTLFTEAKAAETAEKHATEEEATTEKAPEDNITDAAKEQINESQKDAEDSRDPDELEKEDFAAIKSSVEAYVSDVKSKQPNDAPALGSAKIEKGKNAGKSDGGDALKKAKGILSDIACVGEKVVENVYIEEYFTEMFTCRTDNQMLNSLTASKDKKSLPVIMMNGFGNEAAKPAPTRLLNEDTEWYGKEIEYLLWGNSDLNKNLTYTDAMIFAIRFALNAIYAFTAPDIQSYALELATAIAGWTVVGVPIVQVCITILIALAESGYDLYLLHDGRDVPIYKNQMTFVCSPTGFLKTIATEAVTYIAEEAIEDLTEAIEEKLDNAIDEFEEKTVDFANAKLSDCADALNGVVEDFGERQTEALTSAIQKQFITPILNQVIPLGSLAQISEQYSTANIDSLVHSAVEKAFQEIERNVIGEPGVTTGMEPGVVRTLCEHLIKGEKISVPGVADPIDCGDIYSTLKSKIEAQLKEYFADFDPEAVLDFDLEGKIRNILDEAFAKFSGVIAKEVDKAKKYISDEISKHADEAASTAKAFMREKLDAASAQLSGKLKNTAENYLKDIPEGKNIDTDASSGITLNYKEYCKIFMLLFVSLNQDQMLQRAAVLITANMRHIAPIKDSKGNPITIRAQEDFDITNANTLFSVNAQVQMMTLFPWPVKDMQDETNSQTGIQLDLQNIRNSNMTINYCGVNGY